MRSEVDLLIYSMWMAVDFFIIEQNEKQILEIRFYGLERMGEMFYFHIKSKSIEWKDFG